MFSYLCLNSLAWSHSYSPGSRLCDCEMPPEIISSVSFLPFKYLESCLSLCTCFPICFPRRSSCLPAMRPSKCEQSCQVTALLKIFSGLHWLLGARPESLLGFKAFPDLMLESGYPPALCSSYRRLLSHSSAFSGHYMPSLCCYHCSPSKAWIIAIL